jgi:hypothetical protein
MKAARALVEAIAAGDEALALDLLERTPELARHAAQEGATRGDSAPHFLAAIGHYLYAGDTPLHIAAAAHAPALVRRLLAHGADVHARNRHGAAPIHYAADGAPGTPRWNGEAQAETIACLLAAGADPNDADPRGVTPLHRAVRTRSAAAVRALLAAGADPGRRNRNGSTPVDLTRHNTGRSGSGGAEAKVELVAIVALLGG